MTQKSLGADLAEMTALVGYVQKDAVNTFHKYGYASANAVFTKVREELSTRGIHIVRDMVESRIVWQNETVLDAQGNVAVAGGTNVIYHWAGYLAKGDERVAMCGLGQGSDKTDKAAMKAQTAALKYALSGTFLISWGDDPEADEAVPKKRAKAPPPKKPRGATKKDPIDIALVLTKMQESSSVEELDKLAAAAKRCEIRASDRPKLNKAYKAKKEELS